MCQSVFTLDTCISILSCISPLVEIGCSGVMTVGIPAPVCDSSIAALKGKHVWFVQTDAIYVFYYPFRGDRRKKNLGCS